MNLPSPKTEKSHSPDPQPDEQSQYMDYETNLNNIDDLIADLNKPKQSFSQDEKPESGEHEPGEGPGYFQDGLKDPDIDPEKAARAGERTAKMVDAAFTFVNGSLIAKSETNEHYKATPGELKDLSEAWGEIAEEYDFNINPWLKLAILNVSVYLPKTIKAFQDRRFNEMEKRIREMEKKYAELERKAQEKENNENEQ